MNLLAVLLFVCISAADDLICYEGKFIIGRIDSSRVTQAGVHLFKCATDMIFCGKKVVTYSSNTTQAYGTIYFCADANTCKKDGECYTYTANETMKEGGEALVQAEVCCSSKSDFSNVPNIAGLFTQPMSTTTMKPSEPSSSVTTVASPSTTTSSAFSTRALLAVFTAFLGLAI